MQQPILPSAPILTPLQAAWLEELGLESLFVARYLPPSVKAVAQAPSASAATPAVTSSAAAASQTAVDASEKPIGTMFQAGQLAATLMAKMKPAEAASQSQPSAQSPVQQVRPVAYEEDMASVSDAQAPASPLERLKLKVEACTACSLHGERHLPVVGSGAAEAVELMVIGEAPGAEDDRVGLPFRGKAGELLQAMLRAIGIADPARVYLTHLLKCRPVGNRAPSAEEVAACMTHLRQQIRLTQPKQLLVLGRVAAQALLGDVPVEAMRGRLHTYEQDGMSMPVVVTYHPAALLSRPRHKAAAWQDLSLLQLQK